MKSHIIQNIIQNYQLVNGQKISNARIKRILKEVEISMKDFAKVFGIEGIYYHRLKEDLYGYCYLTLYSKEERKKLKVQIKNLFQGYTQIDATMLRFIQTKYHLQEKDILYIFSITMQEYQDCMVLGKPIKNVRRKAKQTQEEKNVMETIIRKGILDSRRSTIF